MHIGNGTIWFKGGYKPSRAGMEQGDDGNWTLRLSTYQATEGAQHPKATGEICDRCFQEMSATGECWNCD